MMRAAGGPVPHRLRRTSARGGTAMATTRRTSLALAISIAIGTPVVAEAKDPRTKVILNGKLVPVTFNDGDSFRVLSGSYNGAKARLAGYNTLESYGPVHSWGTWTAKELYVIAKMATLFARRGTWECTSDGKLDTYGRMLVICPELRAELVRLGMAHVMSIDDAPGDAELLKLQKEAQEARRGIWAHGVPAFILTSLHSREEDVDGKGTYNRLIATDDGHSVKWRHDTKYEECSTVCSPRWSVDEAKVDEVAEALKTDPAAASILPIIEKLSAEDLRGVVRDFAEFRHINRSIPKDDRSAVEKVLVGWAAAGRFGEQTSTDDSCMVHIDFKRRFGTGRAACLK
jgi:endonuclease YncB( thermonuclease family)